MKCISPILALVFLSLLTGCSPSKKLQRLQKKHPELFQTVQQDTVIHFFSAGSDTSFVFDSFSSRDTFYISETKTWIYRHIDTIKVKQEGIDSSFTITKNITYETGNFPGIFEKIKQTFWMIVTILAIAALLSWINKKRK